MVGVRVREEIVSPGMTDKIILVLAFLFCVVSVVIVGCDHRARKAAAHGAGEEKKDDPR